MLARLLDSMAPTLRESRNKRLQNIAWQSALRLNATSNHLGETKALISTGMCPTESDSQEDKENFRPGIAERIKQSRRSATDKYSLSERQQPASKRSEIDLNTQHHRMNDRMSSNISALTPDESPKCRRSSNGDQPAPKRRCQQHDGPRSPATDGAVAIRTELDAENEHESRQPDPSQQTATQLDAIVGLVQFSHVQNPLYAPTFIPAPVYEAGPILEHIVPRPDAETAARPLLREEHADLPTNAATGSSSAVANDESQVEQRLKSTTPSTDAGSGLVAEHEPEAMNTTDDPVQLPDEESLIPATVDLTDEQFVEQMKSQLMAQGKWKTKNVGRSQANRILELLDLAKAPTALEALILSSDEARAQLQPNVFFPGPVFVEDAQPMELHTVSRFLDEYYDDTATVSVQDPALMRWPHARTVTMSKLKERFLSKARPKTPWNCLELAAHVEDGVRPSFLNSEDCRLITKLKHPRADDLVSRRGFEAGYKEIEKWALLAQAGSLTEPHQDSHGYSTFITVNQGAMGFGWLANPTPAQRNQWNKSPATFTDGDWRYKIVRQGQTVYFPNGTVHFVFRLRAAGDTLAFGGHVLRCSQIVSWVKTLLEEQAYPAITNEPLSVSAPAYLERVTHFVKQARRMGQEEKWGGAQAIQEFLRLKDKFIEGS